MEIKKQQHTEKNNTAYNIVLAKCGVKSTIESFAIFSRRYFFVP